MWPGVTCSRCTGRSPSLTCRPVRQTAQTRTWTSSSPGAGAGTGFSTYLSGPVSIGPGSLTTQAFIVSGLPAVIPYPYHRPAQGRRPGRDVGAVAAQVLGVAPGTLRMRLMRGRARLRKAASPDPAHGSDPASEPE